MKTLGGSGSGGGGGGGNSSRSGSGGRQRWSLCSDHTVLLPVSRPWPSALLGDACVPAARPSHRCIRGPGAERAFLQAPREPR